MSTQSNRQAMGLQVFYNEDANVNIRTKEVNNESWFVAKDICDALGLVNSRKATSSLEEDERGVSPVVTPSGIQDMTIVNESGLYNLIFQSRKPEARAFRRWVTNTVLPSIRLTGSYSSSTAVQPAIEQRSKLPLPKFRPFYAEWKAMITPYISPREIDDLAVELNVTPGHVRKVYQGTSASRGIVDMLTATASMNRQSGVAYPLAKSVYEQMVIAWGVDCNENL